MARLDDLLEEISNAAGIYLTDPRSNLKPFFLLLDDYVELASKLYLLTNIPKWKDTDNSNHFKNFHTVTSEVQAHINQQHPAHAQRVRELCEEFSDRRRQRNGFFHSADLLALNTSERACLQAFDELVEYVEIIFGTECRRRIAANQRVAVLFALVRAKRKALFDGAIEKALRDIFCDFPINQPKPSKKGMQVVEFPTPLHERACLWHNATTIYQRLRDAGLI